jgi:hypothetical protein
LSGPEREVLEAWLSHDVPSARELRQQLEARHGSSLRAAAAAAAAAARSVSLATKTPSKVSSLFEIDAFIVDESGVPIGGMVLFVRDGRLHDIDVHSWTDAPTGFRQTTEFGGTAASPGDVRIMAACRDFVIPHP